MSLTGRRIANALTIIAVAAAGATTGTGCGGSNDPAPPPPPPPDGGWPIGQLVGGGDCHAVVAQQPDEGANHLLDCAATSYVSVPPSSGNHYGTWAAYTTYAAPVPWGFLVHSLEHGAVVISYNCPGGCPADLSAAAATLDAAPVDPTCSASVRHRLILTPDPTLPVRFAASAWGFTLRADCFDPIAFSHFIAAHYAAPGTEPICADGLDLSANHWCP